MSRRMRVPFPPQLALALAMLACGPDGVMSPTTATGAPQAALAKKPAADKDLVVYSQNVYVGTDVDALMTAAPDQIPTVLPAVLGGLLSTNWPERADAMAAEIGRTAPDVVVLNEITTVHVSGLDAPFDNFNLDFLQVFRDALAARGLDYVVAGSIMDTDANLGIGPVAIHFQDFDVVLVRSGLAISDVQSGNYAARFPVDLGFAGSFWVTRGWVAVTVSTGRRTVRVVGTHIEPDVPVVKAAQTAELVSIVNQISDPVIVAGDLNSDPNESASDTPYHQLLAAGFHDSWLERNGPRTGTGFSCCNLLSLLNPEPAMYKRIDHVLVRPEQHGRSATLHPLYFDIFGDELSERTVNELWPSDHAGLVVTLRWSQVGENTRN